MVSPSLILTMLTLSGSAGSGRRLTTYSGLTYTTVPATASTIWTIMGAPHHEPSKRALSVPQAKLVPFDWLVISNAKTRKHPRGDTSAREQSTKSRRIRSDQHLQHRAAFVGRKGDQGKRKCQADAVGADRAVAAGSSRAGVNRHPSRRHR